MKYLSFEEMPVWKNAMELAVSIFEITKSLPRAEDYGLTSQIRRSALSVSANIAEGFGRETQMDKKRFYIIAKGSLLETKSHFIYGCKVAYFKEDPVIIKQLEQIYFEINKLNKSIKNNLNPQPQPNLSLITLSPNEIVIYQSENTSTHIDVLLEDETVWLTQLQMVELFQSTKQNISLHISNIFKEDELREDAVVKYSLTTASDGKKYKTKLYNLDVIISVGYRVKSKTGTQFRIWATNTLKTYLLKGYVVQDRIERIEKKIYEQDNKIKLLLNTNLPPNQGVFFDGEILTLMFLYLH